MNGRTRAMVLFLLLILPATAPSAQASRADAVAAEGPSEDGSFRLVFDLHRDAAGPVELAFHVARDNGVDVVEARRDLGATHLDAGTTRWNATFLPAEGAGNYTVTLLLDGTAGPALTFPVTEGDGASTRISFSVADAPTWLNLTSDSVNADGKSKLPGDEVITRALVEDGNGLRDLDGGLRYVVVRQGVQAPPVAEGPLSVELPENATRMKVEHRFSAAPLPAGTYALSLFAVKGNASTASATRTFVIRDVNPTLAPQELGSLAVDGNLSIALDLVLQDANGAPGEGTLEARVYRGSARAEAAGVSVSPSRISLDEGVPLGDAEGMGLTRYATALHVTETAPLGDFRVSLYLNRTLLGSIPFRLEAPPVLERVSAAPEDGAIRLDARGAGNGTLVAALRAHGQEVARQQAPLTDGSATLRFSTSEAAQNLTWQVWLHARPGGRVLAALEGEVGNATQDLQVTPLRVTPRLPAAWRLDVPPRELENATVEVSVLRWDGASEPRFTFRLQGNRLVLDAPADIPAGRYEARLGVLFADGSTGQAKWTFEAGPWMRVALGTAVVEGASARVPLTNAGGVAVGRLVVEALPHVESVSLRIGNQDVLGTPVSEGRWSFRGLTLPPGAAGEVHVHLREGPLPSGSHEVKLRVFAMPGGSAR